MWVTIIGVFIGIGGILIGNVIEGGHIGSLLQLTAFFIVCGGTVGATMVSNTKDDLVRGLRAVKLAFSKEVNDDLARVAREVVDTAVVARRDSILAIEKRLDSYSDPYLKKVFRLVVDGVDPEVIRETVEAEMDADEKKQVAAAKIWNDAGGFAPTIGIIGAVLGLIHVMSNLTDTAQLGKGIAVAFVATIYGVGSANLILLPIGNKIKSQIKKRKDAKEMMLEGALAIANGSNPYIVEEKMRAYTELPGAQGN